MFRHALVALCLAVAPLWGADDAWIKVQELKHGTEIRIYRKGVREPVVAKFDEANGERVLIVGKNSQSAVSKDDIERLDARPAAVPGVKKSTTVSTAKTVDPDYTPHPPGGVPVPSTSYGSNTTFGGSKPDFETVYRRVAALPKP